MKARSVPLIDARWRQSKLSLWMWRAGLLASTIALIGGLASLFVWGAIEIADILIRAMNSVSR